MIRSDPMRKYFLYRGRGGPKNFEVASHENWTIGVSSDDNFGIFKVPNMFLHIICLYCIGVHLSRTISGHLIWLFLDA